MHFQLHEILPTSTGDTITAEITLPLEHPLANQELLIDQLRECGAYFHRRGWSLGTSSNYSVVISDDPVELIVTASGKDKGRLERPDFVRVGSDGQPTVDDQPKASAETMLHVVLASRPMVGCILHTHSVWGTLMSDHFFDRGQIEVSGYEMLKGLEGIPTHDHTLTIPIFENTQDIPRLAEEVRAKLEGDQGSTFYGFLIRKHGLYTWGRDVFSARRHIEIFEFLFECLGRKLTLSAE